MSKTSIETIASAKDNSLMINMEYTFGQHLYNDGKNKENLQFHKKEFLYQVIDQLKDYLLDQIEVEYEYPVDDIQTINLSLVVDVKVKESK